MGLTGFNRLRRELAKKRVSPPIREDVTPKFVESESKPVEKEPVKPAFEKPTVDKPKATAKLSKGE